MSEYRTLRDIVSRYEHLMKPQKVFRLSVLASKIRHDFPILTRHQAADVAMLESYASLIFSRTVSGEVKFTLPDPDPESDPIDRPFDEVIRFRETKAFKGAFMRMCDELGVDASEVMRDYVRHFASERGVTV